MPACLDDDEILAFSGDAAPAALRQRVADHLAECAACRILVAETARSMRPDPQAQAQEQARQVGERVGRYELLRVLGAGGAGLVFEAFDPHLNRRVALKLVAAHGPQQGEAAAARLLREAQAMAQLPHPSVVAVFDAGAYEGGVFIAMELIEGRTLAAWLAEERPGWQTIVQMFLAAGQALVAAHAVRLVHRDFKPENVLIGTDGRPRVTDFGLARPATLDDPDPERDGALPLADATLRSQLGTLTQSGVLAGTPAYMAPEQFRGAHADEATDQFNFCASLYAALYGTPPFARERGDGKTLLTLAKSVLEGHLQPPPADTQVPARIHGVLVRGLANDRKDRFPSMAALLAALETTLGSTRRSRRVVVLASGLALGVAAVATVAATVRLRRDARGLASAQAVAEAGSTPRLLVTPPADIAPASQEPAAPARSTTRPATKAPIRRPERTRAAQRTVKRPTPPPRAPATPVTPLGDGLKDPYDVR